MDRSVTPLGADVVRAAERGDVESVVAAIDAGTSVNSRSVFQTTLLHLAAKRGDALLVQELLVRGAAVNALDYGGMRRTALHWACQMGHVRCVELLVDGGADTQMQGRTWSKLVQGQSCGKMIDCDSPFHLSPESLCKQTAVRFALLRPEWTPTTHVHFPKAFRDAARVLVISAALSEKRHGKNCSFARLGMDECREVLKRLAYPISAWL